MIFVTVGNATQGFLRLLQTVDDLAGNGYFNGEIVIIQSGHSHDFRATHCQQEDFLPPQRFAELIRQSDVVVCHGGAGTLYHVFQAEKIPVVMPRRRKYGEHLDDQLELVKTLATQARVIPAYEPDDLPGAISAARERNAQPSPPPPSRMITLVAQAIEELIGPKL